MANDTEQQDTKIQAKSHALDVIITITELVTIVCFIKGNPAWRGGLGILLSSISTVFFYKYLQYHKKPYLYIGLVFVIIAIAFLVSFGMTI